MPKIPSIYEQELRNHTPARLDDAFLDRLNACAEGTETDLTEEDAEFAELLAAMKPRALSAPFQASLFAATDGTPFAVDEKIVLFHKQSKASLTKPRSFNRFNLAAAAAVALLGATAAFMVPHDNRGGDTASSNDKPVTINPALNSHFAPASYGQNLSETRDAGVIWRGKNQPHRVLRLTYTDKVTMKNAKGETIQVEQPRYEYVIIPEKID